MQWHGDHARRVKRKRLAAAAAADDDDEHVDGGEVEGEEEVSERRGRGNGEVEVRTTRHIGLWCALTRACTSDDATLAGVAGGGGRANERVAERRR